MEVLSAIPTAPVRLARELLLFRQITSFKSSAALWKTAVGHSTSTPKMMKCMIWKKKIDRIHHKRLQRT